MECGRPSPVTFAAGQGFVIFPWQAGYPSTYMDVAGSRVTMRARVSCRGRGEQVVCVPVCPCPSVGFAVVSVRVCVASLPLKDL